MMTHEKGLSPEQATELLTQYGTNVLPEQPLPSGLQVFFSQLKNPLVYVLLIAGIVTLLLQHVADSIIIFFSVFLNTILGFIQEKKANQAFAALNHFIVNNSEVIRGGERVKIETASLVPGDLVILSQGTKVPADGQLSFVNRVYFDEAIITGESNPVLKQIGDPVFMGTTVQTGQAMMVIQQTGSHTRIGTIAKEIQTVETDTPLTQQLSHFSKKLVILILGLIAFVCAIGIIRGNDATEIFTTSVALAVSSIPEGLIVSLTIVLAMGMQRILKRRGLVRKLASAETLGGVTTICVDKTGTLTEGHMQVVEYVGDKDELALQVLLANDLDDPIVIAAYEWGETNNTAPLTEHKKLDSIPFSSKERLSLSLHKWTDTKHMLFVNGAPDTLLQHTTLSPAEREHIHQKIDMLTAQGKRVMGLARKEVPLHTTQLVPEDAKNKLTWIGVLAFTDPVRPSVQDALEQTHKAGIKTIVITGDYAKTAQFVLAEIGIHLNEKQILLGTDIEQLNANELSQRVKTIRLFARTTPDQKLLIVEALQKNGEVVAMMGDGVNDAPAIHAADIGIVVHEASDVARESADLILLDSNFSTIIAAVEEGRSIFDNIRKIILYLLSDAFAEILVVIGSILLGLPLPVTAIQIIWINLVSDGLPDLALTVDTARKGLMEEPPRSPQEKLINTWMAILMGIVSISAGTIAFATFVITYKVTGNLEVARSMTFITLGMNSLSYVFSVRSLMTPFWQTNLLENKWLVGAAVGGFLMQLIPFVTHETRNFFNLVWLDVHYWIIAMCLSIGLFFIVEIFKFMWTTAGSMKAKSTFPLKR